MAVPPHPHMGLQTVSWLVQGTVLYRDSIGTTALVEPGCVAVMSAGNGIAHSENSPANHGPVLHGAQLWVALPESTERRAGSVPLDPVYEHMLVPLVGAVLVCGEEIEQVGVAEPGSGSDDGAKDHGRPSTHFPSR